MPSPGESNLRRELSTASSQNGIFDQWPKCVIRKPTYRDLGIQSQVINFVGAFGLHMRG
jgi:hypothetical protein